MSDKPINRNPTLEELQAENLRIQNEHLKAQSEFYADQNEKNRMRKSQAQLNHAEQEKALAEGRSGDRAKQRHCTHRKGGKGNALMENKGNSGEYAIALQGMPDGSVHVWCTRCFAHWEPGATAAKHPTGIAYEEALNWPTDNSPSGTVLFRFPSRPAPEEPNARRQLVPVERE